ncbi:MAG: DUF427 domain-containing protein [Acidimicrobiales bacterium]
MSGFPGPIVPTGHVEPVPRRIRATRHGHVVVDTTDARYVWEWPHYPQYYIPRTDVREDLLVPGPPRVDGPSLRTVRPCSFAGAFADSGAGWPAHPGTVARLVVDTGPAGTGPAGTGPAGTGLAGTIRFDWDALDAWFEEDEEVFVHPRSPYSRVDALRSTRSVRIELEGVVLAESSSPVMVFETGLPTRYYLNRTEVRFEHLESSPTVTGCPYKGTTTAYWSCVVGGTRRADLAWSYDFPTRQLLPIAGLVSFYNEKVDVFIDGAPVARPVTHFSD